MIGVLLFVLAILLVLAGWICMHEYYKRIFGVRLVWWAIPFAHGSILFVRRLDPKFERPLREKRKPA